MQYECTRVRLYPPKDEGSKSTGFLAPHSLLRELVHNNLRYLTGSGFRKVIFPTEPLGILLSSLTSSFANDLWSDNLAPIDGEEANDLLNLLKILNLDKESVIIEIDNKSFIRYFNISGLLQTIDLDPVLLSQSITFSSIGWAEVEKLSHFGWEIIGVDNGWAYLRKPLGVAPDIQPDKDSEAGTSTCGDCSYFKTMSVKQEKTGIIAGFCNKHKVSLPSNAEICEQFSLVV